MEGRQGGVQGGEEAWRRACTYVQECGLSKGAKGLVRGDDGRGRAERDCRGREGRVGPEVGAVRFVHDERDGGGRGGEGCG